MTKPNKPDPKADKGGRSHSGDGGSSRRGVLKLLSAALGGALGVALGLPLLRFFAHPLFRATVTGGEEPIRVAGLGDLKPGEPVRVGVFGSRQDAWLRIPEVRLGACWLVRTGDGSVRALSTVCPHLGCGIDWNRANRSFDCPCHGSVFDATGRRVSGPSPRDMDTLDVELSGADVRVKYRRFRVATHKKEPIG